MADANLESVFAASPLLLTEGALGERLKREYGIVFHERLAMAALYRETAAAKALSALWRQYAAVAARYGLPLLLTTPTRRLTGPRAAAAGEDPAVLAAGNASFLSSLARELADGYGIPVFSGALMGCVGDAYTGAGELDRAAARDFHLRTAERFAAAGVQFLMAGIMPALSEALGMAQAMAECGLPYFISFTIEKNGCLIDGTPISAAIAEIDAQTARPPLCYMTNCVHPSIAAAALSQPVNDTDTVRRRFLGIQANTSPLPYAALDGAVDLMASTPQA
ncbi:MAG: homocysteine S-methyltransferase family protein, partial [Clostridia bacterium]|nr:homocysteine S-methyltransferase family protein [Clostridia bacterium]